jgi:hypothetical protein
MHAINEVDLHNPQRHGNTVTVNGMRTDTIQLLTAGMLTRYRVVR